MCVHMYKCIYRLLLLYVAGGEMVLIRGVEIRTCVGGKEETRQAGKVVRVAR